MSEITAADILSDPTAVHLNMLRGGIAKPSPANIWHIYGQALFDAMPQEFRTQARAAALEEAREPTEAMMNAGEEALVGQKIRRGTARFVWKAMLDEALTTNTQEEAR